jgi:hypothetical protein
MSIEFGRIVNIGLESANLPLSLNIFLYLLLYHCESLLFLDQVQLVELLASVRMNLALLLCNQLRFRIHFWMESQVRVMSWGLLLLRGRILLESIWRLLI